MNLLFLLLVALPICVAQFRIQGPSDGNRAAESLSVDDGGKVEYSGHRAPSSGGFSIQGASDGHSNVQGASDGHSNVHDGSDGHSNFQLQAAFNAGANRYLHAAPPPTPAFSIQGASDGHSQIQGSYDGSDSAKSLQYDDPSGYRVNWRSYDRAVRPQSQPEAQYTEEVQASLPRAPQRQRARARPQQHAQPQPQPQPRQRAQSHEPVLPPVQPYESAPAEIKQLLHFQKMLPYLNIIPEPFRYDNIISAQQQQQPQAQYQADDQPRYIPESRRPPSRGKARVPSRQKRRAQRQPPPEQHLQYSTNLPPEIRQILKFQQQTPYINGIPEQFRFNTDAAVKEQLDAVRAHLQEVANTPPERYAPKSRQRRQAQYNHRQQQPQQPPAEPRLQYSTNLPGYVKDLLNYQAQIPYTILPNLIGVTRPEKPYVPQPVQSPTPAPVPAALPAAQPQYQGHAYQGQPQYQGQPNAPYQGTQAANPYQNQIGSYQNQPGAYQDQGNAYQGQPNIYKNQADAYQPQQNAYNQVFQSELKYSQQGQPGQGGVRPVTENQY
ncbi:uncharacterized protein LOC143212631 [Lasioglossum baleicum]|uniref:uncharacterized protein LOC143212631 n=1 Tax=Lasioglossum baleicum TaxID=434251 RepID=UPI003FCEE21F